MPNLSSAELKELLERELPGVLQPTRPRTQPAEATASAEPARKPRKGEEGPVDLLATDDAVVAADRLVDVALFLRDKMGYTYLSNITATDYLADGVIEMVYHFYSLEGGGPAVIKVRVPRDAAEVPSLTPHWPGANLQEREAFDLFGVRFPGHPFLERIYMWDEFEGHPMRRDFPKQGDKYLSDDDEV